MLEDLRKLSKDVYDAHVAAGKHIPKDIVHLTVIIQMMDEAVATGDQKKYEWLLEKLKAEYETAKLS